MAQPPDLLLGNPDELIVATFGGKTFKGSRRTHAHLWETQRQLNALRPGVIRVLQPCYNVGYAPSMGTHDKDAVVDAEIIGWDDWYAESDFLRRLGWAGWVRTLAQGFPWHHHMASRGTPASRLGDLVPAQLDDFDRHALGLKGQHDSGDDPQCFDSGGRLRHTISPVFNYATWQKEYAVTPEDRQWIKDLFDAERELIAVRAAELVMGSVVDTIETGPNQGKKVTTKLSLRQSSRDHREVL